MTNIDTIIHLLRDSDRPVSHDKLMQDAATALSRIPKATAYLYGLSVFSDAVKSAELKEAINILEGKL